MKKEVNKYLVLTLIIMILWGGVIGYNQHLIKEKLNYKFSLIKKEVALLSRLNMLDNQNSKDTTCLDVLCIGNSILCIQ